MEIKPLIELKGITKRFGSFVANEQIHMKIYPGEVHAILGENGAGKSTLMNIIYGMYRPDEGSIWMDGEPITIKSPRDALRQGIGMVHQHYMLVDVFTSAENVFLIGDKPWWTWKKDRSLENILDEVGRQYGLAIDTTVNVEKLTVGMQQRVEILKLLYREAKILIFDEPTAVLAPQEADMLFETMKILVAHGKSVVFISHKLEEVLKVSQRITVLNKGSVVGTIQTEEADQETLIRMIVGSDVEKPQQRVTNQKNIPKKPVLQLEGIGALDERGVKTLGPMSLTIGQGEIVGIAGVEGNGQSELVEVAAGIRPVTEGQVKIQGLEVASSNTMAFINGGISYVPADRNAVGSVKKFPLSENWILRSTSDYGQYGLLDYNSINREAEKAFKDYDVRAAGIKARTGDLSGGNLQKFILAREIGKDPRALVCAYPTRGLDIKATWFIREKLIQAKEAGVGIMLVSGDLEELFYLSDRIIVLYRGQVIGEVIPGKTSFNEVGLLMTGVRSA